MRHPRGSGGPGRRHITRSWIPACAGMTRQFESGERAFGAPRAEMLIKQKRLRRQAMDVGIQMVFASYGWDSISDAQVWDEEIRLARLADELGYDVLWSVEHHFYDYSFCPDNLQLMSYLAGVTKHVDLGTAAVILPWHDPLRVAEQVAILDQVSGGRFRLGIGRGLSRREFGHFRGPIAMDESRERFDEAAPMILDALKTGFMEGDGKFYKQARTPIRPKPAKSFEGRT